MVTGIICEYNPFHNGHRKQLEAVRTADPEGGIVCLMSGNYVQRGMPAIFDRTHRAKAALLCGADLVLEMPVTYSLRSAEGFAAGGVSILSGFCDRLCFGAEDADTDGLMTVAEILLSAEFSTCLKEKLSQGLSFPAARQAALEALGADGRLVNAPNNILAVEYCKAIRSQGSPMKPMPISREGGYHSLEADTANPSATFVRKTIADQGSWQEFVPEKAAECFSDASLHSITAGQRAVLYRLRTMTDAEFEALPYGSEGLWRKLMHNCREKSTLEEILEGTKSKRYTRTRLDRMVMCAFLGITREMLESPAPYTRVLALNDRGREILKNARATGIFSNIGERIDHPYQQAEALYNSLYGLFAESSPESPDGASPQRITIQ